MLRSFYSGVSGLRNHQQSMDVIGNNISNVNTAGYKGSRVTFVDTLSQTLQGARQARSPVGGRNPTQVGLGMTVSSIDRNMGQGTLQATGANLDLAIEGNGFFVVGQGTDYFYSRAGSFSVDDRFNLVTSSGDQVYGWVDTNRDGRVDSSRDEVGFINLDRWNVGKVTNVRASATPTVAGPNSGSSSLGTLVTNPSTLSDRWRIECVDAATGQFRVSGEETGVIGTWFVGDTVSDSRLGTFTISSGTPNRAILYADANGDGEFLKLRAKDFGAGGNNLSLELANRGVNQSLGVSVTGSRLVVNLATDALGQVTSTEADIANALRLHPTAGSLVEVSVVTRGTVDANGDGAFDDDGELWNTSGAPVGAGPSATAAAALNAQYLRRGNGPSLGDYFTVTTTAAGAATLEALTVGRDGTIVGIFENGSTEEIARVALASVPNPQGLLAMGGGRYAESPSSGSGFPVVTAGANGTGGIAAGFLEMSNVDLSREFTDMIVTQRGFQANSRIITTSDEMLQDLLALKR